MLDISELMRTAISLHGVSAGVYFLFDANELVYIGESWNCVLRVGEHTKKKGRKVFGSWNFIPVEEESDRKSFEDLLVQRYQPKYNKAKLRGQSS
jgi:hypothetical protein